MLTGIVATRASPRKTKAWRVVQGMRYVDGSSRALDVGGELIAIPYEYTVN